MVLLCIPIFFLIRSFFISCSWIFFYHFCCYGVYFCMECPLYPTSIHGFYQIHHTTTTNMHRRVYFSQTYKKGNEFEHTVAPAGTRPIQIYSVLPKMRLIMRSLSVCKYRTFINKMFGRRELEWLKRHRMHLNLNMSALVNFYTTMHFYVYSNLVNSLEIIYIHI